jgi:hypothetical protein
VAVPALAILGQFGVELERLGVQPGGGGVEPATVTQVGHGQPVGGIGGMVVTLEHS